MRCFRVPEAMWVFFVFSSAEFFVPNLIRCPQLFDFKNLDSFSLRLESAFYAQGYFDANPGGNSLSGFDF